MGGGLGAAIVWQGALIGLLSLGVYVFALASGRALEVAKTMAFAAMALMQLVHSFNARSLRKPLLMLGLFSNKSLVWAFLGSLILQMCVLFLPFLRGLFGTALLSAEEWLAVAGFSLLPLVSVEAYKALRFSSGGRRGSLQRG